MGNNLGSPVVEDDDVDAGSILEDNRQDIYAKTGYNFPITPNFMEHFGADKIAFETPMPQLEPHTPHVPPSTPVIDAAHPVSPLFPLLVALRSIPNVGQSCYITTALHILARLEHIWLPQLAAADWSIYDPSFAKHVELISSSHDAPGSASSSTTPTPPTGPASPALSPLPSLLNLGFSTDALWFDHNWFSLLVRAQPQIARVRVGAECVPAATSEEDSDGLDIGVFSEDDTLATTGVGLDFDMDASHMRAQHDHFATASIAPVPLPVPTTADNEAVHAANTPDTVDKPSSGPHTSSTSLRTHHGESVPRPPASHPRLAAPAALAALPAVPAAVQMFPPACALVLELLRVAALLNGRRPSLRVTSPYACTRTDSASGAKGAATTSTSVPADLDAAADGAGASVSVQPLLAVLPRSSGLAAFSHAKQGDCLEFLLSLLAVVHYTAVVCAAAQRALRNPHPTTAPTLSLPAALSPLALMSDTVVTAFVAPRVWLPQLAALLCFEQRTRKTCHCCVRLPAALVDTHTSPSCCAHRTTSHTQGSDAAPSLPTNTYAVSSELARAVSATQRRAGESGLSFDCLPAVRDMLHQLAQRCQYTHAANKGYLFASAVHPDAADWEQLCVRAPQGLRYSVVLHADGRLCVSVATVSFLNVGLYCGRAGSSAASQSAASTGNGASRGQEARVSSTAAMSTAGLATLTEAQELVGEAADATQAVRAAFEQSGWRRAEDDDVSVGVRVGKAGKVDVGVWLCGVRCEVRDVRDVRVVVGGADEDEEKKEVEEEKEDVQEAPQRAVPAADGDMAVHAEEKHSEELPAAAVVVATGGVAVVSENTTQEEAAAVVDEAPTSADDEAADCAVEAVAAEAAPQDECDPSAATPPIEGSVAIDDVATDGTNTASASDAGNATPASKPAVEQWGDDVLRLTIAPFVPAATATADGVEVDSAAADVPVVLVRLIVRPYMPAPPQRSWWSWLFPSRAEPTHIATATTILSPGDATATSTLNAPMLGSTPPPSLEPIPVRAADGADATAIPGEDLSETSDAAKGDIAASSSEAGGSAPAAEDAATVVDGTTATAVSAASAAPTAPPPLCLSSLLRWHFPRLPLPALHEHHHAARCTWRPPRHPHEAPLSLPLSSPLTLASGLLRSPDALILRIDTAGNSSPYAQRRDSARGACGRGCACSRVHGERSWWRWGNKAAPVAFPLDHSLTRPHNRWELPETSSSASGPEKQNVGLMRVSQDRYPRSSPQTPTPWYALQGLCLYTGTGASGHYKAVVRGRGGAWHIADGEDVQPVCVATDHVASEDVYFAVYSRRGADGEAWARATQLAEGWR